MKRTRSPKWRRWLRCKPLTRLGSVLLGFALGATLVSWAARASAYRTAASDPTFAGTERVRWATDEIRFRLHTDLPPELDLSALEVAVVDSLAKWSRPTCSRLEFVYEANTSTAAAAGDGVNTIQWVRDGWVARGFDPTAAAVTDVQYQKDPGGAWTIVEADLYLNGESNRWVIRGAQGADRSVQSVLLHEAGHMLGLLHPCEVGAAGGAPDCAADPADATSAVYPIYSFSHNPVLAADDEAGVCFLYPGIRCEVTGCSTGLVCQPAGCVAPCGDATCAPGQTCAGGQCTTGAASIASIAPPPATSCSPEVPCPAGQRCEGSRCQGASPAGDPCSASTSCSSGICEAGYCAATCELDSDCGLGSRCTLQGEPASGGAAQRPRTCAGMLPMGASCAYANECLGGECLAEEEGRGVCSRPCGEALAACPNAWECAPVGAKQVCRPPDGPLLHCAITHCVDARNVSRPLVLGAGLIAFGAFAARRRRERQQITKS